MGPGREKDAGTATARVFGRSAVPRGRMTKRGRLIAVEGPSASGKSTLVRLASQRLGWMPLPEAFDRLDPAPSLEFGSPRELLRLEGTLLAAEARRYAEAQRECRRGRTVLADTGFLGPWTYTRGLVALGQAPVSALRTIDRSARSLLERGRLGLPDLTVYLLANARERARRARGDVTHHPTSLWSRHEAVGAVERYWFRTDFPRALPERFRSLRSSTDPRSLVSALRRLVAEVDPSSATRAEGVALLDLLPPPPSPGRRRNVRPNR
jgi:hypothetical protein